MCQATDAKPPKSTSTTKITSGINNNSSKQLTKMSSTRSVTSQRSSSKEPRDSGNKGNKPAFAGAKFDKDGCCVMHSKVVLAEQVKQDGRLLWKEVRMTCPKCQSEHHRSRRVTSLGGAGKVKKGRTMHGMSNPLRDTKTSGRHMDVEFSTPFDDKGRCHHHPQVQMASKKVRGGWKILMAKCPQCIEAEWDEDAASVASSVASSKASKASRASSKASKASKASRKGKSNQSKLNARIGRGSNSGGDDQSVSSKSTKRSVASRTTAVTSSGKWDKNGCCTQHPHMQVAKKKLLGGWKELRECPKCADPDYDDMNDAASFSSKASRSSRKSTSSRRSVRSSSSRKGGTKTSRYAALPFDDEGYCHAHPSVRLAKKKKLGGWKVIHDICPDCAVDAGSRCSSRSSKSKKSGTGRYFDPSASEAESEVESAVSSSKSSRSGKRKKISVKDMKYRDENGNEGRYSGDVDEDHQPHGQGKMKYKDGTIFTGVWSEGSQVHGKTTKGKKSSSSSKEKSEKDKSTKSASGSKSSKSDWARRDPSKSTGSEKKTTVRKMKWMDYYGDPGEYTGEVDSSNMPHGKGSMKYDHGLIQEGLWEKGQFVDGSDETEGGDGGAGGQKSGQRSSQETPPKKRSSKSKSSSRALISSGNRDP